MLAESLELGPGLIAVRENNFVPEMYSVKLRLKRTVGRLLRNLTR
jgi:hypothetical protein